MTPLPNKKENLNLTVIHGNFNYNWDIYPSFGCVMARVVVFTKQAACGKVKRPRQPGRRPLMKLYLPV
ncbi:MULTISPECIES: hypothetical protein [unclassified Massilia]|uniref:hypothetical protein n=1 Tax=unclassified Massilia TaxID=2609279 RepID=UPI001781BB9D|nr:MULTISPECIES: hypothetical protein [unclassified Massilia]MBD8530364.1 hypothetical protein [Massilia sp. CFBP 13647]MBD8673141.1 hypothetical protein [Massilia sp. CFBP 13721]